MCLLLAWLIGNLPLPAAKADGAKYQVTASKVNLRAEASTSSKVLALAREGDVLTLVSDEGQWLLVVYNGVTGYIASDYVIAQSPPAQVSAPAQGVQAIVNASKLNIRLSADTDSTILSVAREGRQLEVLAIAGNWIKVRLGDVVGYVMADYVTLRGIATDTLLQSGDAGESVTLLQGNLKALGFFGGAADGKYGAATEAAVKAFQRANSLRADGKAGAQTLAAIAAAVIGAGSTPSSGETLRKGSAGEEVRVLQRNLKSLGHFLDAADGQFGPATENAVKAFQSAKGLTADGVAGTQTLAAIATAVANDSVASPVERYQRGDEGDGVAQLQRDLIALGHLSGAADGIFGRDTESALKAFQSASGLAADGIASEKTLAALATAIARPGEGQSGGDELLLQYGDKGDKVQELQAMLANLGYYDGIVGGSFGSLTKSSVRAFQAARGLTADGVVGAQTWAALVAAGSDGASGGGTLVPAPSTTSGPVVPTQPTSPLVTAPPVGYQTLRYGDAGDAVKALQTRLLQLGYFAGSIGGNFGTLTQAAVTAFQQAAGLTADGVAGSATQQALYATGAPSKNPGDDASASDSLKFGDVGERVLALQTRLKELGYLTLVDGEFGAGTRSAIMSFQWAAGLTADGVAGTATLAALTSSSAPPYTDGGTPGIPASELALKIIASAKTFLGTPYVWGANGPKTFDCSGFTKYVFNMHGMTLLRTAYLQGYNEKYPKIARADLQMGDLVFFNTISDSDLSDHVGIYISDGNFIHAGSSTGVVIRNLSTSYYNRTFSWGRRILGYY